MIVTATKAGVRTPPGKAMPRALGDCGRRLSPTRSQAGPPSLTRPPSLIKTRTSLRARVVWRLAGIAMGVIAGFRGKAPGILDKFVCIQANPLQIRRKLVHTGL